MIVYLSLIQGSGGSYTFFDSLYPYSTAVTLRAIQVQYNRNSCFSTTIEIRNLCTIPENYIAKHSNKTTAGKRRATLCFDDEKRGE